MKSPGLSFWFAAALLLTACGGGTVPGSTPAPPPDLTIFEPGKAGRTAVVPTKDDSSRRAGGHEDRPHAVGWTKPGVTRDEQLADTEACYTFAWAQVDNDIRIDNDIAAARGQSASPYIPLNALTQQADTYYYRKERIVRLENCMQAKGYSPR